MKNSSASISEINKLYSAEIDALDLAIPETTRFLDRNLMEFAVVERAQAGKELKSIQQAFTSLKDAHEKNPEIALRRNPAFIDNHPLTRQLHINEQLVAQAQENFELVRRNYLARHPGDTQGVVANIRSAERRGSV